MWKLAIEDDQGHRTVVNLVRDEYTIGRAQENTVRLTERNISRRHAVLRRTGSTWLFEDQSSYNGCYVNGVRVAEPKSLETGDLIQLGDYRLEVADESVALLEGDQSSTDSTSPSGLPRHSLTGQPDRLVMLVGPNPGMEFPLENGAIIGRGEECDISLNHGSVSRVHAEVQTLGDGRYEIIDRESANGVRVNGAELQRALLDARDTIELGDIVLKFIPAGMIYRPGVDESQQISSYSTAPDPLPSSPALAADAIHGSMLTPGRIAAVGAALVLALVLGIVIVSVQGNSTGIAPTGGADGAARVLEDAQALLESGEVEAAHRLALEGIPETSNARQSSEFTTIEARWADQLFDRANAEADRDEKRELLEQIAQTTSVDSERRKRAADMIAALDSGGVDISQLPEAEAQPPSPDPRPPTGPVANVNDLAEAEEPESPDPPIPPTAAAPASTAARQGTNRRSPTTADPSKAALSGSRSAQLAAINAYRAKKAAGTLTDQEARLLRALCRQHGVPDCSQ